MANSAVLQFLADGTRSFSRSRGLNANDFDQVNDTTEVILLELLARQAIYLHRHRRVWLLLDGVVSLRLCF